METRNELRNSEKTNHSLQLKEEGGEPDFSSSVELKNQRLLAEWQLNGSQLNSTDKQRPDRSKVVVKSEIDLGVELEVGDQGGIKEEVDLLSPDKSKPSTAEFDFPDRLMLIAKSCPNYEPSGENI
ncbi:Hypothetical protein NTJ_07804 [Nesidiocoris tenuis]|uniref:Uncharacterized protein n=1 Tax=Nesidiocoris tenuis TaxID=355587 RepID=A0ABN7AUK6_9HEMI|nr:Hypothetical protein NTJ_07804 [Nesidiocoris tenuis]